MEVEISILKENIVDKEYDYREAYIGTNEGYTGYKAIFRGNEFIAIVGGDYKLLPNERAIEIADEVAKIVGAMPFEEAFDNYEFVGGKWVVTGKGHIAFTKGGRQVHCFYKFPEKININNDTVNVGFCIHNSIDGSMGFSTGLFTFRYECSNLVFFGLHKKVYGEFAKVFAHVYQKHTKGLDPSKIKEVIMDVIDIGQGILKKYQLMAKLQMNLKFAKSLRENLPKRYLPEYLKAEELNVDEIKARTLWETYNDITELIWHRDTEYQTKKALYDKVHAILKV